MFSRYKQFGAKPALSFGFAKSSKYKTNFKLSLIPKLLVACVSRRIFIYCCLSFPFLFSTFQFFQNIF